MMTHQEALLFFPLSTDEQIEDIYLARLFEYKQFFVTKTPIRKLFQGKLNKLMQMDSAYRVLSNQKNNLNINNTNSDFSCNIDFSNVVSEAFSQWETEKGKIKHQILSSMNAQELEKNVFIYLNIAEKYYRCWYCKKTIDVALENISVDSDPMEILRQIQIFESKNGRYFSDIIRMNNNVVLLKEMKRLSLLIENYGNEKRNI